MISLQRENGTEEEATMVCVGMRFLQHVASTITSAFLTWVNHARNYSQLHPPWVVLSLAFVVGRAAFWLSFNDFNFGLGLRSSCVCESNEEKNQSWNGESSKSLRDTKISGFFFLFWMRSTTNICLCLCLSDFLRCTKNRAIWPRRKLCLIVFCFFFLLATFAGKRNFKTFHELLRFSFFLSFLPSQNCTCTNLLRFSSNFEASSRHESLFKFTFFLLPARRWWDLFETFTTTTQREWRFKVETENLTLLNVTRERK